MHPLEKKAGYRFKDPSLLHLALMHPSLAKEDHLSNQRLEFLGDAVLQLCVSTHLYKQNETMQEGQLSKQRAALVQEQALFAVAQRLEIGKYITMGPGEAQTGGREKPSILSDAVEAFLGAVYLDGGLDAADQIVQQLVLTLPPVPETIDYKTRLQEQMQAEKAITPHYLIVEESGPPHDKRFVAEVYLKEQVIGRGVGSSKKAAEQAAAQDALK